MLLWDKFVTLLVLFYSHKHNTEARIVKIAAHIHSVEEAHRRKK